MDQVTLTSKHTELPSLRMLAMESHLSRQGGTIEKVQLTAIHALGMERPSNVLEGVRKKWMKCLLMQSI